MFRLKEYSSALKYIVISRRMRLIEYTVLTITLAVCLYQAAIIILEWLHECRTVLSVGGRAGWVRLPGISLCFPLRTVLDFRLNELRIENDPDLEWLTHIIDPCLADDGKRYATLEFTATTDVLAFCIFEALYRANITYSKFFREMAPWSDLPANLTRVQIMFPNGTSFGLYSDLITFSGDFCWTYLTDSREPSLGDPDSEKREFSGYIDHFGRIFLLINHHPNLTLTTHSSLLRSERTEERVPLANLDYISYGFDYNEIHKRHCTRHGSLPCREYSPRDPSRLDPINWSCPPEIVPQESWITDQYENSSSSLEETKCNSFSTCTAVAQATYAAKHIGCSSHWELFLTRSINEWSMYPDLPLCPVDPPRMSRADLVPDPGFVQYAADLDFGRFLCPRECTELTYTVIPSNMAKVKRQRRSRDHVTTVELFRNSVPSIRVDYIPGMTNIQFLCNVSSLLGIWYGASILGLWSWTWQYVIVSGKFKEVLAKIAELNNSLKGQRFANPHNNINQQHYPTNGVLHRTVANNLNLNVAALITNTIPSPSPLQNMQHLQLNMPPLGSPRTPLTPVFQARVTFWDETPPVSPRPCTTSQLQQFNNNQ